MTPMLRQYRQLKERHRDAILFFRLGDFYEAFFEDAEIAARELGITLTGREMGKGNRAPMAGIPYHAADNYVSRLVERGYRVAICEQVEAPAQARGLVRREVVRVVTPGTVSEGRLLPEKGNRWLVAACRGRDGWGIACADASTGEFLVTTVEDRDEGAALREELARVGPAELLVPEPLASDAELVKLVEEGGGAITPLPEAQFEPGQGEERLREHFRVASLTAFGLESRSPAMGAAAAVLAYLRRTQGTVTHIGGIRSYQVGEYLVLDRTAVRNLELFRRLPEGGREGTLFDLLDETVTSAGGRRLRSWLQRPLLQLEAIEKRHDAVEDLANDPLVREEVRQYLRRTCDGERILVRAATGSLVPRDLGSLRWALQVLGPLRELLAGLRSDLLKEIAAVLEPPAHLVDLLSRALRDDLPAGAREGDIIREGYSPEVDRLRLAAREGRRWLAELEAEERERTGIKSLKIGYNQVFGYYFEVTKANLAAVPADWTRQQTLAGAERFFTPRLKELEATILGAQEQLYGLEYRLFGEFRDRVLDEAPCLRTIFSALADLDALAALAEVAVRYGYVRPKMDIGTVLTIEEGRHPVLERTMGQGRFLANSISLGQDCRMLIITGPNMAGKSTYIRQVALIVIMAQMGGFVPARRAQLPLVDRIFVRVGAYDDLTAGQSTFMVEMAEVAQALRHASPRSLVLLDEIGRGTSTFDGMSIAWAVAEYLHDRVGCLTLLATHYRELIALGDRLPAAANCSVAVQRHGNDIVFLHRVVPGGADASYGVEVARLAGLPPEVIERAQAILASLEADATRGRRAGKAKEPVAQLRFFPSGGDA